MAARPKEGQGGSQGTGVFFPPGMRAMLPSSRASTPPPGAPGPAAPRSVRSSGGAADGTSTCNTPTSCSSGCSAFSGAQGPAASAMPAAQAPPQHTASFGRSPAQQPGASTAAWQRSSPFGAADLQPASVGDGTTAGRPYGRYSLDCALPRAHTTGTTQPGDPHHALVDISTSTLFSSTGSRLQQQGPAALQQQQQQVGSRATDMQTAWPAGTSLCNSLSVPNTNPANGAVMKGDLTWTSTLSDDVYTVPHTFDCISTAPTTPQASTTPLLGAGQQQLHFAHQDQARQQLLAQQEHQLLMQQEQERQLLLAQLCNVSTHHNSLASNCSGAQAVDAAASDSQLLAHLQFMNHARARSPPVRRASMHVVPPLHAQLADPNSQMLGRLQHMTGGGPSSHSAPPRRASVHPASHSAAGDFSGGAGDFSAARMQYLKGSGPSSSSSSHRTPARRSSMHLMPPAPVTDADDRPHSGPLPQLQFTDALACGAGGMADVPAAAGAGMAGGNVLGAALDAALEAELDVALQKLLVMRGEITRKKAAAASATAVGAAGAASMALGSSLYHSSQAAPAAASVLGSSLYQPFQSAPAAAGLGSSSLYQTTPAANSSSGTFSCAPNVPLGGSVGLLPPMPAGVSAAAPKFVSMGGLSGDVSPYACESPTHRSLGHVESLGAQSLAGWLSLGKRDSCGLSPRALPTPEAVLQEELQLLAAREQLQLLAAQQGALELSAHSKPCQNGHTANSADTLALQA